MPGFWATLASNVSDGIQAIGPGPIVAAAIHRAAWGAGLGAAGNIALNLSQGKEVDLGTVLSGAALGAGIGAASGAYSKMNLGKIIESSLDEAFGTAAEQAAKEAAEAVGNVAARDRKGIIQRAKEAVDRARNRLNRRGGLSSKSSGGPRLQQPIAQEFGPFEDFADSVNRMAYIQGLLNALPGQPLGTASKSWLARGRDFLGRSTAAIGGKLRGVIPATVGAATGAGRAIAGAVTNAGSAIAGAATGAWGSITDAAQQFGSRIATNATRIGQSLKQKISPYLENLANMASSAYGRASRLYEEAFDNLWNMADSVATAAGRNIVRGVGGAVDAVSAYTQDVVNRARILGSRVGTSTADNIRYARERAAEAAKRVEEMIKAGIVG